ncbi:MAG: peptide deformylase [Acidocella sp.]|nr:peptide deformylase [Acidocella sp.]
MAILKIARMGHPVLLAQAMPVADVAACELVRLVGDMVETLADAGGVGLAAPQVFRGVRLFIYHVPGSRADDGADMAMRVVFNPVVTPLGDEMVMGWEGCLSIPGLRAAVPRFARVRLAAQDETGAGFEVEASGFEARVIQHEADHLDGVMYPMRMRDFRYFGFNEEISRSGLEIPEDADAD